MCKFAILFLIVGGVYEVRARVFNLNLTVDESFSLSEPVYVMNELLPDSLEIVADLTSQPDGHTVCLPFRVYQYLKSALVEFCIQN